MNEYIETNRLHWDDAVPFHFASDFYDVAGFKAGRGSLLGVERDEIGDVAGKTLLHLQCHFGLDTLSWAREGAIVTGVDFSGAAIAAARELASATGIEARFLQSDIYDLPDVLSGDFDVIFASYGVTVWLPDFRRWAKVAGSYVKAGGTFYLVDAHPLYGALDYESETPRLRYSYFHDGPRPEQSNGTYATAERLTHDSTYEFQHSLGDIVTGLIDAGLRLQFLHEFPFAPWRALPGMEKGADGFYRLKEGDGTVPLTFSVRATKPL